MNNNEQFYINNKKYSEFLESQDKKYFKKYVDLMHKYTKKGDKILDIGCGTGIALKEISKIREAYGIDISKESIKICNEKKLSCNLYDGNVIPFKDSEFDLTGSINVLEHVDNTNNFLKECLRVTKDEGYILVTCTNFLSITNNYHKNTRGIKQKILNISEILKKLLTNNIIIKKMEPTNREEFQPDDDAVNVTNPIDLIKWGKRYNLKLVYFSSQQQYKKGILSVLDNFFITRILLGSVVIIFKK